MGEGALIFEELLYALQPSVKKLVYALRAQLSRIAEGIRMFGYRNIWTDLDGALDGNRHDVGQVEVVWRRSASAVGRQIAAIARKSQTSCHPTTQRMINLNKIYYHERGNYYLR